MKTFRQFNELFDKKIKWEFTLVDNYTYIYKFKLNPELGVVDTVTVDITQHPERTTKMWELAFARNLSFDITGGGNALEIFGTVNDILKDFIKRKDPEHVFFTAKEPSRKKLYKTLVRKLAPKLNMRYDISINEKSKDTQFNLRKK
jgi:hypothetical protein